MLACHCASQMLFLLCINCFSPTFSQKNKTKQTSPSHPCLPDSIEMRSWKSLVESRSSGGNNPAAPLQGDYISHWMSSFSRSQPKFYLSSSSSWGDAPLWHGADWTADKGTAFPFLHFSMKSGPFLNRKLYFVENYGGEKRFEGVGHCLLIDQLWVCLVRKGGRKKVRSDALDIACGISS